ncbi:[protein-PII] uridylyltransferase [Actinomadura sp. HBU206391]|uniref:[protein-PII] uridylyltransferase n=1 Tax=Actinomadura sp. HBU206391 TaxID=2731692 RepID=UPI00164FE386|nr:[protein-PII] uridylyltransferase [Actinomadura sp. HBU206391]MBC6460853.1 [protein-PII] uridylyltransferase [Actinomadura sp. HBU206391]
MSHEAVASGTGQDLRPPDRPRPGTLAARQAYADARATRADELDRWLAGLLGPEPGVALVAVGSHGRRDLTPGGDLDLVLLHRGRSTGGGAIPADAADPAGTTAPVGAAGVDPTWEHHVAAVADRIWYPVWDSGLRLDHSVRTVHEARTVARGDLKAALGLMSARRIAGEQTLVDELRAAVLADWRADARQRLGELSAMTRQRWETQGELAFLLEPDLKEARGGLRDVHVMQAVAASWVAPAPDERVRAAYRLLLDARHALHDVTGRAADRLVLQEQEAVARALGLLDANMLLRTIAEAARTVTYAADHVWRHVDRFCAARSRGRGRTERRPLADGVVEHDGEAVLARGADPADPVLVLRIAAAAAQAGLPLAPATVDRLAECVAPMPVPWPAEARDALVALLGAGPSAIPVWEALDQAGMITRLLPDWERVRNRPQRNPVHRFTVDRHLVETAAGAAALTREVARPDLLLVGALLHDIGKGWPGDHSRGGAVVARDMGARMGFDERDVDVLEALVRHHLLLPDTATRRDLDDPVTIRGVADTVGGHEVLELLAALSIADGLATGPAAWGGWKAGLVAELVRRVTAALAGRAVPRAPEPSAEQLALARHGGGAVRVVGTRVTVVAPDRPGLLWRAAGVLALHRLAVRTARGVLPTLGGDGLTAMIEFTAVPEYGNPPDPAVLEADLRRVLADRLDVAARLERRAGAARVRPGVAVPPPRVTIVDDASNTATVIEVRAHDRPGLLWQIGQAIGACGLQVRAAQVDTLGANAVDVFYVVGADGAPIGDTAALDAVRQRILKALR